MPLTYLNKLEILDISDNPLTSSLRDRHNSFLKKGLPRQFLFPLPLLTKPWLLLPLLTTTFLFFLSTNKMDFER